MAVAVTLCILAVWCMFTGGNGAAVGTCTPGPVTMFLKDDTNICKFYTCAGGPIEQCCPEGTRVSFTFPAAGSQAAPCGQHARGQCLGATRCTGTGTGSGSGATAAPTTPTTTPTTTQAPTVPTPASSTNIDTAGTVTCDFTSGPCGWYQDPTDQFDWKSKTGTTDSVGTGPLSGDHTTGSGSYYFIDASSPRKQGDAANLFSPIYTGAESRCLTFWYYMLGKDINTLKLYMYLAGQKLLLFTKTGQQGPQWIKAQLWLPAGSYQLVFEGTVGADYQGDIAIDDISITKGQCPVSGCPVITTQAPATTPSTQVNLFDLDTSGAYSCTFGTDAAPATCTYDDTTANFNWQRWRGATSSPSTGPSKDHTTGLADGNYFYAEASTPRAQGDKARMLTRTFKSSSQMCLDFWLHMFGGSMGTFNAYISYGGTMTKVYSATGDKGDKWINTKVDLPPGEYRIVLEAVVGSNYMSDIAVDDIKVTKGECSRLPSSYCFFNPCKNGGSCVSGATSFTCTCPAGFIGKLCDQKDHCASSPCQNGGTCSVLPTTFKCACVCGWGGDTCSDCGCSGASCSVVIQQRVDGTQDFNQDWATYEKGFGTPGTNVWLGLTEVSKRTQACKYQLRVDLSKWDGSTISATYDTFKVAPASDDYRLSIGNFNRIAGDIEDALISVHNNQKFTTKDKDNDAFSQNCADVLGGGWWFASCASANPNGIYSTDPTPGKCHTGKPLECVSWAFPVATYLNYSFKGTRLQIKRI